MAVAGQGNVLARLAHAAGKLLRGVLCAQHKHPLGGGRCNLAHGVVAAYAVFLNHADKGGGLATLGGGTGLLLLNHLLDIVG